MRTRLAIGIAALALTLVGTIAGSDDDFPVGPFRMYATSARATGTVRTAQLYGVLADGTEVPLEAHEVGLRRAELEGQLPRFRKHPELLGALARPEDVSVRLVERVRHVVDRKLQGDEQVRVVAAWHR